MSVRYVVALLLAAVLFWYFGLHEPGGKLSIGVPPPEFSLPDETGQQVSLSDLKGNVVLVNFWATTCPPCVQELPSLNQLSQLYKDKPFKILGINEDGPKDNYQTFMIPESFLIDGNGRLVRKITGAIDWTDQQVIQEIDRLISDISP